jgi:hypothetical protein
MLGRTLLWEQLDTEEQIALTFQMEITECIANGCLALL